MSKGKTRRGFFGMIAGMIAAAPAAAEVVRAIEKAPVPNFLTHGRKIGDTITIRKPPRFLAADGQIFALDGISPKMRDLMVEQSKMNQNISQKIEMTECGAKFYTDQICACVREDFPYA